MAIARGKIWPTHAYRRQRAKQQLQACVERIRIQSSVIAATGLQEEDSSAKDAELVNRLRALAPCISAQMRAEERGEPSHSDRLHVSRNVHALGIGARHIFGEPFDGLTPDRVRALQRGQRRKQEIEVEAVAKSRPTTAVCPGCMLFFPLEQNRTWLRAEAKEFWPTAFGTLGNPPCEHDLHGEATVGSKVTGDELCGMDRHGNEACSSEDIQSSDEQCGCDPHGEAAGLNAACGNFGDELCGDDLHGETGHNAAFSDFGNDLCGDFLHGETEVDKDGEQEEHHDVYHPSSCNGASAFYERGGVIADLPGDSLGDKAELDLEVNGGQTLQEYSDDNGVVTTTKTMEKEVALAYPLYGHGLALCSWKQTFLARHMTWSSGQVKYQVHQQIADTFSGSSKAADKKRLKQKERRHGKRQQVEAGAANVEMNTSHNSDGHFRLTDKATLNREYSKQQNLMAARRRARKAGGHRDHSADIFVIVR